MIRRVLAVVCLVAVGVLPAAAPALADAPPDYPAWQPVSDSSHCLTTNWGGWQCLYGGAIQTQYQFSVTNERVCAQITALAPSGTQLYVNIGTGNLLVSAMGNYCVSFASPPGTWITATVQAVTGANFAINLVFSELPDDTATPTVAPSSTVTNTPVASPTRTNTPAPGFTPAATSTPTLTSTALVSVVPRDCGMPSFPLLDCNGVGLVANSAGVAPWVGADGRADCFNPWLFESVGTWGVDSLFIHTLSGTSASGHCSQMVVAGATGEAYIELSSTAVYLNGLGVAMSPGNAITLPGTNADAVYDLGPVVAGSSYEVNLSSAAVDSAQVDVVLREAWVSSASGTPTPPPFSTAVPSPVVAPPTETPVGAIGGPPSAGGCGFWDPLCNLGGILEGIFIPSCLACETSPMVKAVETEVPVSPAVFAPLGSLATGSSCQAFGGSHIPIMDQVEHPSVVVLSVTFAPCAHPSQFPTGFFADVRSLATVVTFILFFLYVIRFVQRVFGRRHLSPE